MMFGRSLGGNQVFETFHQVWSIEGYKVIISKLILLLSWNFAFVQSNIAYSDEMQHIAAFHQGIVYVYDF